MVKIATITHLFPNPVQPILGIFVLHRVKAMAAYLSSVEVIAPVGWLPYGISGRPKQVPKVRTEDGLLIHHPRFVSPPILKPTESLFFLAGVFPTFTHRHLRVKFDVLETHFGYPDAPAIYALAQVFRLPFVVTVRGEDVYGHPRFPLRRIQIVKALKSASRIVCLSQVTYQCCVDLGVPPSKIVQIPNGVDSQVFRLVDREIARKILGLSHREQLILSAGWIIPRKGYHYIVQALPHLKKRFNDIRYVIIGGDTTTGEYKRYLVALAKELGVEKHILFIDAIPQEQLALWINAADVFCFPSEKEGWGNVALEALCCGTPVIAHDVGGIRQMIMDGLNGFVLKSKSTEAWVDAITESLCRPWDRPKIRESVAHWRWEEVGRKVASLMQEVWIEFRK